MNGYWLTVFIILFHNAESSYFKFPDDFQKCQTFVPGEVCFNGTTGNYVAYNCSTSFNVSIHPCEHSVLGSVRFSISEEEMNRTSVNYPVTVNVQKNTPQSCSSPNLCFNDSWNRVEFRYLNIEHNDRLKVMKVENVTFKSVYDSHTKSMVQRKFFNLIMNMNSTSSCEVFNGIPERFSVRIDTGGNRTICVHDLEIEMWELLEGAYISSLEWKVWLLGLLFVCVISFLLNCPKDTITLCSCFCIYQRFRAADPEKTKTRGIYRSISIAITHSVFFWGRLWFIFAIIITICAGVPIAPVILANAGLYVLARIAVGAPRVSVSIGFIAVAFVINFIAVIIFPLIVICIGLALYALEKLCYGRKGTVVDEEEFQLEGENSDDEETKLKDNGCMEKLQESSDNEQKFNEETNVIVENGAVEKPQVEEQQVQESSEEKKSKNETEENCMEEPQMKEFKDLESTDENKREEAKVIVENECNNV